MLRPAITLFGRLQVPLEGRSVVSCAVIFLEHFSELKLRDTGTVFGVDGHGYIPPCFTYWREVEARQDIAAWRRNL